MKEIADATVFLLGDTGNFVNGQTLVGKLFFQRYVLNLQSSQHLTVLTCDSRRERLENKPASLSVPGLPPF